MILDNLSIHRGINVQLWALAHKRVRFLFQPTYAPWLNLIEPWWKTLGSLALAGRRFDDLATQLLRVQITGMIAAIYMFGGKHIAQSQIIYEIEHLAAGLIGAGQGENWLQTILKDGERRCLAKRCEGARVFKFRWFREGRRENSALMLSCQPWQWSWSNLVYREGLMTVSLRRLHNHYVLIGRY